MSCRSKDSLCAVCGMRMQKGVVSFLLPICDGPSKSMAFAFAFAPIGIGFDSFPVFAFITVEASRYVYILFHFLSHSHAACCIPHVRNLSFSLWSSMQYLTEHTAKWAAVCNISLRYCHQRESWCWKSFMQYLLHLCNMYRIYAIFYGACCVVKCSLHQFLPLLEIRCLGLATAITEKVCYGNHFYNILHSIHSLHH